MNYPTIKFKNLHTIFNSSELNILEESLEQNEHIDGDSLIKLHPINIVNSMASYYNGNYSYLNLIKEKLFKLGYEIDLNNFSFINNENLKNLTCNTYFTIDKYKDRNQVKDIDNDNNDKKYPEISGYRTVNINTVFFDVEYAKKIFNKSMVKILRSNKFRTHLNNFINSLA